MFNEAAFIAASAGVGVCVLAMVVSMLVWYFRVLAGKTPLARAGVTRIANWTGSLGALALSATVLVVTRPWAGDVSLWGVAAFLVIAVAVPLGSTHAEAWLTFWMARTAVAKRANLHPDEPSARPGSE